MSSLRTAAITLANLLANGRPGSGAPDTTGAADAPTAETLAKWRSVCRDQPPVRHPNHQATDAIALAAHRSARDRMLSTRAGQRLMNDVYTALARPGSSRATIRVTFSRTSDFPEVHSDANYFAPGTAGEPEYEIWIAWQFNLGPNDSPGTGNPGFYKGSSLMAQALFHEIMHVWFVHAHPDAADAGDLGHGHPVFQSREDEVVAELLDIERKLAR